MGSLQGLVGARTLGRYSGKDFKKEMVKRVIKEGGNHGRTTGDLGMCTLWS